MISKHKVRYLFYSDKLSYSQIAKLMGVSRQYIHKIITASKSKKLSKIREIVLKRDDSKCQFCFSNKNIHIHHINGKHNNNNPNNMLCLCSVCHQWVHDQQRKAKMILNSACA